MEIIFIILAIAFAFYIGARILCAICDWFQSPARAISTIVALLVVGVWAFAVAHH